MAAPTPYDRWAFEAAIRESDLPANARLLALTLATVLPTKSNHRKRMTAGKGPRLIETLARETGLSRRTLFRACEELEAAGFLSRIAQSGRQGRRSSIFRLHLLAKCQPDTLSECQSDTLGQCHSGTQYRVHLQSEGARLPRMETSQPPHCLAGPSGCHAVPGRGGGAGTPVRKSAEPSGGRGRGLRVKT